MAVCPQNEGLDITFSHQNSEKGISFTGTTSCDVFCVIIVIIIIIIIIIIRNLYSALMPVGVYRGAGLQRRYKSAQGFGL